MKCFTLILALIASTFAHEVQLKNGVVPQKLAPIQLTQQVLPRISWEHIMDILATKGELGAGFIQADVTAYALQVIGNVEEFITEEGYDPMQLSDELINLIPTGTVNLTDGWLEQLSTINISDAVIARYTLSTKILELTLPLAFDSLVINYDYVTKITLVSITGTVVAKVTDVKLDLHLGFNFSNFQAFVDKADIKNSGKIDVDLTGLGLLDWIIDLMTGVLTTLFHGIILSVVNLIIQDPVDSVVEEVNEAIDHFLHPNATTLLTY